MKYNLRWAEWLAEGRIGPFPAAIVMVAAYFALQTIILSLLSSWAGTGVGIDDAEQLIYIPYLWAGYGGSQPPLYTWINWLAAHVFGTSIFTLKLVKYSVLFLAACSVFAAMRRFGYTKATAAAAMFGLFTIPQIVWESQRALSHSVAVVAFCSLLLLAMAYLLERRSMVAYAAFGLATAAAILAKYNDVFLVVALVAAVLSLREWRSVILDPKFAISIAVAILVLAPTTYWSLMHPADLLSRGEKFGIDSQRGRMAAAFVGAGKFIMGTFNFAVLPVLVSALAFGLAGFRFSEWHPKGPPREILLRRTLALGLAMLAILVLATGVTVVKDRWLLPVLFMLPLAIVATMERLAPHGRNAQLLVIAAGAIIAVLLAPATWYVQINGTSGLSRMIRVDYPALYRQLTADGPVKTAISDGAWVGNLRLVDEKLVALDQEVPNFEMLMQEPAVLVWLDRDDPRPVILEQLKAAGYEPDGQPRQMMVPLLRGTDKATRPGAYVRLKRMPVGGATAPKEGVSGGADGGQEPD
ncbi:glycosyltransferase family 39 protein [Mesorhizobium sp. M0204]|uniref:ArnT family glycosyltransferase n=1 Tax=unclassified Mesorhizobium TaxID=325217 RepID=UPI00333AC038